MVNKRVKDGDKSLATDFHLPKAGDLSLYIAQYVLIRKENSLLKNQRTKDAR